LPIFTFAVTAQVEKERGLREEQKMIMLSYDGRRKRPKNHSVRKRKSSTAVKNSRARKTLGS
jgi:hypothetical protein